MRRTIRAEQLARDRHGKDRRARRVEAAVVAGAPRDGLPAPWAGAFAKSSPWSGSVQRVAAQLEGGGDVDGAVERAGEQAAGQGRAPDRGGAGAAQAGRVAQAGGIGRGDRDQARDQGRGQGRAAGERAQGAQHPVGIDAGRVDGEGDHHDRGAQAEHGAGGDRLGGDVDLAQQRPLAEPGEHRLAAAHNQGVDEDDQQSQGQAHPQRGAHRRAGAGEHGRPGPRRRRRRPARAGSSRGRRQVTREPR